MSDTGALASSVMDTLDHAESLLAAGHARGEIRNMVCRAQHALAALESKLERCVEGDLMHDLLQRVAALSVRARSLACELARRERLHAHGDAPRSKH